MLILAAIAEWEPCSWAYSFRRCEQLSCTRIYSLLMPFIVDSAFGVVSIRYRRAGQPAHPSKFRARRCTITTMDILETVGT